MSANSQNIHSQHVCWACRSPDIDATSGSQPLASPTAPYAVNFCNRVGCITEPRPEAETEGRRVLRCGAPATVSDKIQGYANVKVSKAFVGLAALDDWRGRRRLVLVNYRVPGVTADRRGRRALSVCVSSPTTPHMTARYRPKNSCKTVRGIRRFLLGEMTNSWEDCQRRTR